MQKDQPESLMSLGSQGTQYAYTEPSQGMLEVFPNKFPEREYLIELEFAEFTSLCPKTGQPDFATIVIKYSPHLSCIETKSLKLYFFAYRNHGSFMETITNNILTHLVTACLPRRMEVKTTFASRGGVKLTCCASYSGDGFEYANA